MSESAITSQESDAEKKHYFIKELKCMLYGFGDDQNPYTETAEALEDIILSAKDLCKNSGNKIQVEDIIFLIRKDPRKFARVKDLLTINEELRRARKAFDEAKFEYK